MPITLLDAMTRALTANLTTEEIHELNIQLERRIKRRDRLVWAFIIVSWTMVVVVVVASFWK